MSLWRRHSLTRGKFRRTKHAAHFTQHVIHINIYDQLESLLRKESVLANQNFIFWKGSRLKLLSQAWKYQEEGDGPTISITKVFRIAHSKAIGCKFVCELPFFLILCGLITNSCPFILFTCSNNLAPLKWHIYQKYWPRNFTIESRTWK